MAVGPVFPSSADTPANALTELAAKRGWRALDAAPGCRGELQTVWFSDDGGAFNAPAHTGRWGCPVVPATRSSKPREPVP